MHLKKLSIVNYRNIESISLDFSKKTSIFVGRNAQGKTNILESIFLLSIGKSHRVKKHVNLIQFDKPFSSIRANLATGKRDYQLEMVLTELGKRIKVNGVERTKLSEYIGTMPVVLFAPEDLSLVKGSPKQRRSFMDMAIGQVSSKYVHQLAMLNKVLTQRNSLLRQFQKRKKIDRNLIQSLDEQLIDSAAYIWTKRLDFLKRITDIIQDIHEFLSGSQENINISYVSKVEDLVNVDKEDIKDLYQAALVEALEGDVARGTTATGPHRDDIGLSLGQEDLKTYGSQGQQRTVVLACKLAKLELIKQETGFYPILLLDDVLSELDKKRKEKLLEYIKSNVQTFITTTSLEGINQGILESASIFRVEDGTVYTETSNDSVM